MIVLPAWTPHRATHILQQPNRPNLPSHDTKKPHRGVVDLYEQVAGKLLQNNIEVEQTIKLRSEVHIGRLFLQCSWDDTGTRLTLPDGLSTGHAHAALQHYSYAFWLTQTPMAEANAIFKTYGFFQAMSSGEAFKTFTSTLLYKNLKVGFSDMMLKKNLPPYLQEAVHTTQQQSLARALRDAPHGHASTELVQLSAKRSILSTVCMCRRNLPLMLLFLYGKDPDGIAIACRFLHRLDSFIIEALKLDKPPPKQIFAPINQASHTPALDDKRTRQPAGFVFTLVPPPSPSAGNRRSIPMGRPKGTHEHHAWTDTPLMNKVLNDGSVVFSLNDAWLRGSRAHFDKLVEARAALPAQSRSLAAHKRAAT